MRFGTVSVLYFLIGVKPTIPLVSCRISALLPAPPPPPCRVTSWKAGVLYISKARGIKPVLEHGAGIQHRVTVRAGLALTWTTSLVPGAWPLLGVKKHGRLACQHTHTLQSFWNKVAWAKGQRGAVAGGRPPLPVLSEESMGHRERPEVRHRHENLGLWAVGILNCGTEVESASPLCGHAV